MKVEQFFDPISSTYTYLIVDEATRGALLIDPVDTEFELYIAYLNKHRYMLSYVLDTHTHADHISANGKLRDYTKCLTMIGKESQSTCIDEYLNHGDTVHVGDISINIMHTPGHTDDSYCFFVEYADQRMVFTGDTLLINGTGRTDFQNGDAATQYASLFDHLLALPDDTIVYPGHDYNGKTHSTIAAERRNNPRLQVSTEMDYVEIMANLNLPNPKFMDIAVPANQACGKRW